MKNQELIDILLKFDMDVDVVLNISQDESYDNLRSIDSISRTPRKIILNSLKVKSNFTKSSNHGLKGT